MNAVQTITRVPKKRTKRGTARWKALLLIPASALAGAIFVVIADLLARTLAPPTELPLGVLTALVGGPFFLWLLRSAGERYRW